MRQKFVIAQAFFQTIFTKKWHWILVIFIFIASVILSWIYYPEGCSKQSEYFATIFSGFGVIIFGASTFILDIERRKESRNEIIKLKRGFDLLIKEIRLQITIYRFDDQNKLIVLEHPTLSASVTVSATSYINNQINLVLSPLGNGFSNTIIPKTIVIKPHADNDVFHISYETGYNPLFDEQSSKNFDVQIKHWRTASSYGVDRNIEPAQTTIVHSSENLHLADGGRGVQKSSGFTSINKKFISIKEVQKYYKYWGDFSKAINATTKNNGNVDINRLINLYDDFCKNKKDED